MGIYGERDSAVNLSQDRARLALEAAGLIYEIQVFPGARHAFFNDTGPRFDAESAAAAYQAMLVWFGRHLTG